MISGGKHQRLRARGVVSAPEVYHIPVKRFPQTHLIWGVISFKCFLCVARFPMLSPYLNLHPDSMIFVAKRERYGGCYFS